MDYTILATELIDDPLLRGYSTMTDTEARVDLNSLYRPSNNIIGAMMEYLINKKHRTNQGGDDTFSPIIGRLYHIARSNEGDDPFGRAGAYAGLDIQHIHACQSFITLFESAQLADLDFNDANLPWGFVEASGAWSTTHTSELQALSDNQISRATELGLPVLTDTDVSRARA